VKLLRNPFKKDATTTVTADDYYQTDARQRLGRAWLLSAATFVVTVVVVLALFYGVRWAYHQITNHKNQAAPAQNTNQTDKQSASKAADTTKTSSSQSGPTSQPSTTASTANHQPAPTATTPAPPSAPTTTPNTGPTSTELPRTGPDLDL
jgi:cytoskeletal protein RodZ